MFLPMKFEHGAIPPWEYIPAEADTYTAGQLVKVEGGKAAKIAAAETTTPPYVCMGDVTVADGEIIPVTRVSDSYVYETSLAAQYAGAAPGVKMQVENGGLTVSEGAGTFELTEVFGTEAGSIVRGRFV